MKKTWLSLMLCVPLAACAPDSQSDDGEMPDTEAPQDVQAQRTGLRVAVLPDGPGKVRLEMTNATQSVLHGSGWRPPALSQLISVRRDGKEVAYLGPIAERAADASNWTLRGGESISQVINLTDFEIGEGGTFEIAPQQTGLVVTSATMPIAYGTGVEVELEEAGDGVLAEQEQALAFEASCNTDQQNALNGANQGVLWLTNQKLTQWNDPPSVSIARRARQQWFGTSWNSTTDVRNPLTSIRDLAQANNARMFCEAATATNCSGGTNAYVLNADISAGRRRVHLCPPYWGFAHDTGDGWGDNGRSRVGILAHEYSHFFSGIGDAPTNTILFSIQIAQTDPVRATNTANNWRLWLMNVFIGI